MKKYLFIVEDLYGGGAEKVLLNTASMLKDTGFEVVIYTLRDRIEHILPDNITPINLGIVTKLTKTISNVFIEKIQASLILKKIKEISPDINIANPSNHDIFRAIKISSHGEKINMENIYAELKSLCKKT